MSLLEEKVNTQLFIFHDIKLVDTTTNNSFKLYINSILWVKNVINKYLLSQTSGITIQNQRSLK